MSLLAFIRELILFMTFFEQHLDIMYKERKDFLFAFTGISIDMYIEKNISYRAEKDY